MVRFNLLRGRFDYVREGILDNTHLRFYTYHTARNLITSTGYSIVDVKFTNWNWHFPKPVQTIFAFCEWEIRQRMTKWWPGLFATQFVIYATASGSITTA